ncbi:MAG: hypothetical protein ACK4RK_12840 [Gemmataceae bacterium]
MTSDYLFPCQLSRHDFLWTAGAAAVGLTAPPIRAFGDGQGIKKEEIDQQHPDKFATPHALSVDARGNLYVIEWLPHGRPRKFAPTPR